MFPLFRSALFLVVFGAAAGLMGPRVQAQGFSRTTSGIEYRIYRNATGRYQLRTDVKPAGDPTYAARVGKIMAVHVQYRTAKDSVLLNSRKQQMGVPMPIELQEVKIKGGLEEALALLQPGDSAVFRFNVDTIFAKSFRQPVPSFISRSGKTMTLLVKAQKLQIPEEARTDQQRLQELARQKAAGEEARRLPQEELEIKAYLQKNNLQGQKTPGGTYYVVTKPGTGPKPQPGQTVSVLYTGMLLDGKVFDSSAKQGGQPISFPLGTGQVIAGWDQGLAALTQGTKAILLIPSPLAYGSRGAGRDIPANAILRFEVELVEVK